MGEQVFFTPQNATALYATPGELESVANGTMSMENLERVVSRSPSRFVPFTIVGILVDGCEAPRMPFSENTASVDAMVPPKNGYYITMEDAHDLVFNNVDGMASFFLVDAVEGVTADLLFRALEPVITGDERARVFDVRAFLNAYMDYASSIARTILLSLSAISIVACSQLIKTTTQMNLSEKIRELGIFQAMGFKRKAILDIVISQVLFVSVIGTGIGFLLGTLLPLNFDLSIMVKFLSGNRIYAVASSGVLTISMTSILTSIGAGIGLPLLFSSVPAAKMRSWTIVEMMNPVYMQVNPDIEARGRNARSQGRRRARRHHVEMKQVVAWLATLVAAITLMAIAPYKMFPSGKLWIRGTESFAWLGLGCLGIVLFLVSLVEITGGGMGMVSRGLSWLFKRYLGPVQAYVPKAIHAHSRRMRNIIGTLLVGTALLVSISIVHDTVSKGDAYSNRTYIGGDVAVYTPLVSQSDIPGIENVPGVGRATVYLYDVMETWRSNIQDGFKYIVNQVDGYGGKGNNINERLDVVVIDPGEYATVNAQGVMHAITKPDPGESLGAFVSRLDEPGTVILQDALARDLHKEVGDRVDANILGITGTLEIVGMATNLPCGPFMHTMDDGFNSSRMAFTSFNTLRSLVEDFIGDVDIVVKNASVESSFIGDGVFAGNVAGYSSGFIDKNQVAGILSTIPCIASSSFRFSTFAPGFPVVNATYDATRVEYLHPNVALAPGMELSLPLRFFIVDPEDDLALSGSQQSIVDAHDVIDSIAYTSPYFPGANTPHNSTVDEVLYTIDKFNAYIPRSSFNDTCYCVANQHVARYSTVDNLTYVYENKVGDVLEVEFHMEN